MFLSTLFHFSIFNRKNSEQSILLEIKFCLKTACFSIYTSNTPVYISFSLVTDGVINYMVGTHTGQVMIYQDVTLKWAAKLEYIPVSLRVGYFQ